MTMKSMTWKMAILTKRRMTILKKKTRMMMTMTMKMLKLYLKILPVQYKAKNRCRRGGYRSVQVSS